MMYNSATIMVLVPSDTYEDSQPIDLTTSDVIWAILLINTYVARIKPASIQKLGNLDNDNKSK